MLRFRRPLDNVSRLERKSAWAPAWLISPTMRASAIRHYGSWESMEGIPEPAWEVPARSPSDRSAQSLAQRAGHRALAWAGERVPGLALAAGLAYLANWAATGISEHLSSAGIGSINGIPVAIVAGIIVRNTIGIPEVFRQGLRTCMVQVLRLAIVLLGLRLSLASVGEIGLAALPVVALCITSALLLVPWLGTRAGLSRRLSTLIAVGTAICGVSAVMATAPAIDAKEDETSYAVACVAIFGMLAMLLYPLAAPLLLGDARAIGMFLGTAIHDTTQVAGAAFAYQQMHDAPAVLDTATVVKIVRNLSMIVVIPLMAGLFHHTASSGRPAFRGWQRSVPLFVLGFLAMSLVRTIGDASPRAFAVLERSSWQHVLGDASDASASLLTVAMAAVGLSTGLAQLKRLGLRPLLVGLVAALTVGVVSCGAIKALASLGL